MLNDKAANMLLCYREGGLGRKSGEKRENGRYLNEERSVIRTTSKPANDSSVTRLTTISTFYNKAPILIVQGMAHAW